MDFVVEDAINFEILSFYQKLYDKNPDALNGCNHFIDKFGITKMELIGHLKYLTNLELLDCAIMGDKGLCNITAKGIDSLRHPHSYEDEKAIYNFVTLGNNSQFIIGTNITIEKSFNNVYQKIEGSDLDLKIKTELNNKIKELKEEINKDNSDDNKIKSIVDYAKKAAPSIMPLLTTAITEAIKIKYGLGQ